MVKCTFVLVQYKVLVGRSGPEVPWSWVLVQDKVLEPGGTSGAGAESLHQHQRGVVWRCNIRSTLVQGVAVA